MPVLSAKQWRENAAAPVVKESKPESVPEKAESPVEVKEWVRRRRMHHPDDPMHQMYCTVDIDGEKVEINGGVSVVDAPIAEKLERRGWVKGAEVD